MARVPRPCAVPACPWIGHTAYCPTHRQGRQLTGQPRQQSKTRYLKDARKAWAALRVVVLARDPMCRSCRVNPSVDVDHITPWQEGGTDHPTNLQGLCRSCSGRKTLNEIRQRSHGRAPVPTQNWRTA